MARVRFLEGIPSPIGAVLQLQDKVQDQQKYAELAFAAHFYPQRQGIDQVSHSPWRGSSAPQLPRYVQNTESTRTLSIRSRDPSSSEDSFMRLQMHILFPRIWLPSVRMSQKDKRDLSHRMGWKAGRLGILPFHFRFLRSEDSDKTYFLQKPRHYHRLHCRCLIFRCGYYLMHGMRTG